MGLTKYVLVVFAGAAISALVVWQLPTVTPSSSPKVSVAAGDGGAPVAMDRIKKDVPPAAGRTDAPKVVKKQQTPTVRHEPPAGVRREVDVRREVAEVSRAVAEVSRAVAEPAPPPPANDAARATARIKDEERVSDHDGKVTFTVVHDHTSGNFDSRDPKATCVGELTILGNEVRFESTGPDRFAASWADVRDTGANKFFGSGIGGFHVTINADGKYKNFNLAPQSKDKAEGKLILDLLRARQVTSSATRRR